MKRGHIETWEFAVAALFLVGVATAGIYVITNPGVLAPVPLAQQDPFDDGVVGEILDIGLARADVRFYGDAPSGDYKVDTFRWSPVSLTGAPDSVPLKDNDLRAAAVRFDGRYESGFRGIVFRIYQFRNLTRTPHIGGSLIFIGETPTLGKLLRDGEVFTISYDPHPAGSQTIDGCRLLSVFESTTAAGSPLRVYDFSCSVMYGARP